jgi:ADP-ribose pyrophosphatase
MDEGGDADGADPRRADADVGASGPAPEWPVEASRVAWRTDYFTAGTDDVRRPPGEVAPYHWLAPADGVAVVARDGADLVLIEGYRPRVRGRFLECPGGAVDGDESATAAARRELREETGYVAGDVELLGSYCPSPWLRTTQHAVLATDLSPGEATPEPGEHHEVRLLPAEDAVAAVREGPTAGWTLTALLLAREEGAI